MPIFGGPAPLRDEIAGAVSSFVYTDLDKRDQKLALSKISSKQDVLLRALDQGEELILIVPGIAKNTGYDCLVVVTTERVLQIRGNRVDKSIKRDDVSHTNRMSTHMGHFLIQIVGSKGAPFEAFASGDVRNKGTSSFWENTIQAPILSQIMMDDLLDKVDAQ